MPLPLTRRRSLTLGAVGLMSVLPSAVSAAKTDRGIHGPIPNVESITPLSPLKLAIPDFVATAPQLAQTARDLAHAIRPLLRASGPFQVVDTDEVNARRVALNDIPQPANWRSSDISALVVGEVSEISATRMRVAFRLWLVPAQRQVVGQTCKAEVADWERVARIIAGEIFMRTNEG